MHNRPMADLNIKRDSQSVYWCDWVVKLQAALLREKGKRQERLNLACFHSMPRQGATLGDSIGSMSGFRSTQVMPHVFPGFLPLC